MSLKPCMVCGIPTQGSRCPKHTYRNGSTRAWRKLRSQILIRDGHRCTHTENGKRCINATNLHVDHIVPLAHGGTNTRDNLTTLCETHNLEKGARVA